MVEGEYTFSTAEPEEMTVISGALNEISSIKRMIGYEKQVYITEKLLFRFLMAHPLPIYKKDQEDVYKRQLM